jgi:hypothetical protein
MWYFREVITFALLLNNLRLPTPIAAVTFVQVTTMVLLNGITGVLLATCSTATGLKPATVSAPLTGVPDSVVFRPYRLALAQLATADWQDRKAIFNVFRQYGFRSLAVDSANRWLIRQDSIRLHTFQALAQYYGWPKASQVGIVGVQQAYLLVQHGPAPVQASYQDIMRATHARGELSNSNYAIYLDRVLVNQDRPQRYGTQSGRRVLANGQEEDYSFPMEELSELDHRRANMQIQPLLPRLQPGTLILKPEVK